MSEYICLYMCVHMCICVCHGTQMKIRKQLAGAGFAVCVLDIEVRSSGLVPGALTL